MGTKGMRLGKYPTDKAVYEGLMRLHREGIKLSYRHIYEADSALWNTINNHYRSFKSVVERAGLKYYKAPVGQRIDGTPIMIKQIIQPQKDAEYAYFIGVLMGDGWVITKDSTRRGGAVGCEACDREMVYNFRRIGYSHFGVRPATYKRCDGNRNHRLRYVIRFNSLRMAQYIEDEIGRRGERAIPPWITSGDENIRHSFLRGFCDAEGHVSDRTIVIAQTKRAVIDGISNMLTSVGIGHKVHWCRGANGYQIHIGKKEDKYRFRDHVNFTIKRKRKAIERMVV